MSHSVTKKRENHREVGEYSNIRAYSETGPQSTRNSHLDAAALTNCGRLREQPDGQPSGSPRPRQIRHVRGPACASSAYSQGGLAQRNPSPGDTHVRG